MPLQPIDQGNKLSKSSAAHSAHQKLVLSDEIHDYSEIYTPTESDNKTRAPIAWCEEPESIMSAESSGCRTGSGDSGLTGLSSDNSSCKPPPPPMHRYPSWEDRIYQVASEGLPDQQKRGRISDSTNNNENGEQRNSIIYGNDVDVPVYATVKGVS